MASNVRQAEPRRLYHQVADQIRNVIDQGNFAPGTRLPPERELAQQLGVSRPSLREALLALEIEGRVEVRMGSGVYVCAMPSGGTPESLALGDSPSELMQARSVLEGSIINLALARVTKPGLEKLKTCLDIMRLDVRRGQSPVDADRSFHVAIAEMTGNTVLARMVGTDLTAGMRLIVADDGPRRERTHLGGGAAGARSHLPGARGPGSARSRGCDVLALDGVA
jgi:DNA-binding FadR family transcriptional regulator